MVAQTQELQEIGELWMEDSSLKFNIKNQIAYKADTSKPAHPRAS